jgi:FkbM family methyltransferase
VSSYSNSFITRNQVYLGYHVEDLLRLVRYRRRDTRLTSGAYTDYFGIKTRTTYFTHETNNLDQVNARFPFPDDGIHAESIEYLGTAKALEASGDDITVVELGAGYAPWLVFSAHVAKRLGKKNVRLVAVEAESARHALMKTHFQDNDIPQPGIDGPITTQIIHGAISNQRGSLTFGSANIHDWGGALQDQGKGDYRGIQVKQEVVPALLISDVIKPLPVVDLLHIDIQGWEARAILASLDEVCSRVRYMIIGTHSRAIEGELISMLRERGWTLMHEKPCQFHFPVDIDELAGATWQDGAQIWANVKLGVDANPPVTLSPEDMRAAEQVRAELLTVENNQHGARVLELEREVRDLRESTSWKVTAPFRKLSSAVRGQH